MDKSNGVSVSRLSSSEGGSETASAEALAESLVLITTNVLSPFNEFSLEITV